MTIGLAQMRLVLWKEFMGAQFSKLPSIPDWENPTINYLAVKWYLLQNAVSDSLFDVSRAYTGQANEYYATLLDEALNLLREHRPNSAL
jgi:hypothetical protein